MLERPSPLAPGLRWRHTFPMPGKDTAADADTKAADLEKARIIVGEFGPLIGPAGKDSETIGQAVAEGIALGRKEGLAMAAKAAGRKGTHGG